MGGSLILSSKRAQAPYYVDELGLSIYTIEELCYYIYNYLEFLDDDFINEDLLNFIGKGMGLKELADKTLRWAKSGSDFGQIVLMIEQDVHYLNGQELGDLKARLDWRRSAKPADRLKKKADTLVALKKYRQAIVIYDAILEKERQMALSIKSKGRLLHNKGMAYAKLFMFGEAARSLEVAFPMLDSVEVLKEIFFLQYIDRQAVGEPECLSRVSEEVKAEWTREITDYSLEAENSPEYKSVLDANNQDTYKRQEFFYQLLRRWKNEYRDMVK